MSDGLSTPEIGTQSVATQEQPNIVQQAQASEVKKQGIFFRLFGRKPSEAPSASSTTSETAPQASESQEQVKNPETLKKELLDGILQLTDIQAQLAYKKGLQVNPHALVLSDISNPNRHEDAKNLSGDIDKLLEQRGTMSKDLLEKIEGSTGELGDFVASIELKGKKGIIFINPMEITETRRRVSKYHADLSSGTGTAEFGRPQSLEPHVLSERTVTADEFLVLNEKGLQFLGLPRVMEEKTVGDSEIPSENFKNMLDAQASTFTRNSFKAMGGLWHAAMGDMPQGNEWSTPDDVLGMQMRVTGGFGDGSIPLRYGLLQEDRYDIHVGANVGLTMDSALVRSDVEGVFKSSMDLAEQDKSKGGWKNVRHWNILNMGQYEEPKISQGAASRVVASQ